MDTTTKTKNALFAVALLASACDAGQTGLTPSAPDLSPTGSQECSCVAFSDCAPGKGSLASGHCESHDQVCCVPEGQCGKEDFTCCTDSYSMRPTCTNGTLVCPSGSTKTTDLCPWQERQ
jgi:hypothetical protein